MGEVPPIIPKCSHLGHEFRVVHEMPVHVVGVLYDSTSVPGVNNDLVVIQSQVPPLLCCCEQRSSLLLNSCACHDAHLGIPFNFTLQDGLDHGVHGLRRHTMEFLPGGPTNYPSLNVVVDGDAPSLLVDGLHGEQELEPVGCCGVVPVQLPLHQVPAISSV